MKVAPDPVMSDVVRQRLEALLAEVRPRHALPEEDFEPAGVEPPGDPPHPPGRPDPPARSPVEVARSPVRAVPQAGVAELAGRAGRRALEFTREHLAAVVVVLLVGCGWTAYSLLQVRSTPVAVAAVPTVLVSPTPTPTPTPTVVVHVLGAVRRPGLVSLPQGARVADAITQAGGLTAAADPGELNLAAVVADGSQLVIGTRARPRGEVRGAGAQGGAGGSGASATVSLNTATLEQLDTLPGVGPVTAQRILDWRTQHGRFTAVTELQEVDGIGPKTYADIAPNVRI
jgi:competence protein ComEA